MNNNFSFNNETGFIFRKRSQCIDWKKLASVDINRIEKQIDIHTLQDNIVNVTFCNVDAELDASTDYNFVKLFKLSQFIIEYLLHSQEYLTNSLKSTDEKLNKAEAETNILKAELVKSKELIKKVQKENRKRRLLLEQQQSIAVEKQDENYFECHVCKKMFMNLQYLQGHISRRHANDNNVSEQFRQVDELTQRCLEVERKLDNQQQSFAHITTQEKNDILRLEQSIKKEIESWKNEVNNNKNNNNDLKPKLGKLEENLRQQILDLRQEQLNKLVSEDQVQDSALHDGIKSYVLDTTSKSVRLSYDYYLEHIRKNETETFLKDILLTEIDKMKALNNYESVVEEKIKSQTEKSRHKMDKMKEENAKQLERLIIKIKNQQSSAVVDGVNTAQSVIIRPINKEKNHKQGNKNLPPQVKPDKKNAVEAFSNVDSTESESSEDGQSSHEANDQLSPVKSSSSSSVFSFPRTAKTLENNPNLLKGLKHELGQLVKDKMAIINISPDSTALSNATANDKLILLRNARAQYQRKFKAFNDIRHKIEIEIDSVAKEKWRTRQQENFSFESTATLASVGASLPFIKSLMIKEDEELLDRIKQYFCLYDRGTSKSSFLSKPPKSDSKISSSPSKQKQATVVVPAADKQVSSKKPLLTSTARIPSSSSDESLDISLSDLTDIKKSVDKTNLVVDMTGADQKKKKKIPAEYSSEEENDWDSISEIEAIPDDNDTVFKMQNKHSGTNVANLAQSIDRQLSGHRNKPVGGIDLTGEEKPKSKPYSMSKNKSLFMEDDDDLLSSLSLSSDFSEGNAIVKTSRQSSIKSGSDGTSVWGSTTS
ncbi:Zinc finger protein DZIP1L [Nymphon striatum]|nr:Zinc finger protein DZIP1L [Nymphon striatum]